MIIYAEFMARVCDTYLPTYPRTTPRRVGDVDVVFSLFVAPRCLVFSVAKFANRTVFPFYFSHTLRLWCVQSLEKKHRENDSRVKCRDPIIRIKFLRNGCRHTPNPKSAPAPLGTSWEIMPRRPAGMKNFSTASGLNFARQTSSIDSEVELQARGPAFSVLPGFWMIRENHTSTPDLSEGGRHETGKNSHIVYLLGLDPRLDCWLCVIRNETERTGSEEGRSTSAQAQAQQQENLNPLVRAGLSLGAGTGAPGANASGGAGAGGEAWGDANPFTKRAVADEEGASFKVWAAASSFARVLPIVLELEVEVIEEAVRGEEGDEREPSAGEVGRAAGGGNTGAGPLPSSSVLLRAAISCRSARFSDYVDPSSERMAESRRSRSTTLSSRKAVYEYKTCRQRERQDKKTPTLPPHPIPQLPLLLTAYLLEHLRRRTTVRRQVIPVLVVVTPFVVREAEGHRGCLARLAVSAELDQRYDGAALLFGRRLRQGGGCVCMEDDESNSRKAVPLQPA
ncbi:hypothetical protein B0H16DRAFT_1694983 [Mycena metata]|uniref:Uncharacterized protein n=1 Tax=Mycena metata TaxID=1033252 RepID=A0AAD7I8U4_9AGAR|nr:hypothetical protein B0H16DRAFT_1694983 [Mycena metata]